MSTLTRHGAVVGGTTARAALGRILFTTRMTRQELAQVTYRWSRTDVIPSVDFVVMAWKASGKVNR
jgi:hypothetical protein